MKPKRLAIILGTVIAGGAVLAIVGRYVLGFLVAWAIFPSTVTNVREYPALLTQWGGGGSGGLADHFPVTIPPDASQVRMSHYPGFLQGGASFQLHLTLPAARVKAIEADAAAKAMRTFTGGGDTNNHWNQPDGVPTTFYYTGPDDRTAFPSSFTIYVLKATPAQGDEKTWDHGDNAGLAISASTNEVVYWCESW
jgi:hypothetical protein